MSLTWQQQTAILHLQHLAPDQLVLAGSGALAVHGMITRTPNDLDYLTELDGDALHAFGKQLSSTLNRDGYNVGVLSHPTVEDSILVVGTGPENEMLRLKILHGRVMPGLRLPTEHGQVVAPLVAHLGKLQALATLPRATHARDVHQLATWAGGWQPMLDPYRDMAKGSATSSALTALHQAFTRVPFLDERRFALPAEQVRQIKHDYIEQARSLGESIGMDTAVVAREAAEAQLFLGFGGPADSLDGRHLESDHDREM